MVIQEIRCLARFGWNRGQYLLLRKLCNQATKLHFKVQPSTATPSTLSDIAEEQTALWVRKLEFRCHLLRRRYEAAGKEYLHYGEAKDHEPDSGGDSEGAQAGASQTGPADPR